jgi:hypothetical protein
LPTIFCSHGFDAAQRNSIDPAPHRERKWLPRQERKSACYEGRHLWLVAVDREIGKRSAGGGVKEFELQGRTMHRATFRLTENIDHFGFVLPKFGYRSSPLMHWHWLTKLSPITIGSSRGSMIFRVENWLR